MRLKNLLTKSLDILPNSRLDSSGFVRDIVIVQTKLDQAIEVLAKFKKGNITPLLFRFSGRIHKIDTLNLCYDFTEGNVRFLSYSVNCGPDSYKITLNTKTMGWKLEEIWSA